jgi:hypothetical protein
MMAKKNSGLSEKDKAAIEKAVSKLCPQNFPSQRIGQTAARSRLRASLFGRQSVKRKTWQSLT